MLSRRGRARRAAPRPARPSPARDALRLLPLALAGAGCVSYEPAPIDPREMLGALEQLEWRAPDEADAPHDAEAASPARLAAFAVEHNPTLRAARAAIGVADAGVAQARLFPELELGWGASGTLANLVVEGTVTQTEVLSGFELLAPLPRPGELDARGDAAERRADQARWRVVTAEWELARAVYLAAESLAGVERLAREGQELVEIARRTEETFERARAAGAATAVEANLARGDLLAIRLRALGLDQGVRVARQELNALLGLPPETLVAVRATPRAELPAPPCDGAGALTALALEGRPDLAALMAAYAAAEQDLRLAVARQWPRIAVGTGIFIVPQLFSRGNEPAIRAALERRTQLEREVLARVHRVRNEVHLAWIEDAQARRELDFLEQESLPNAQESLRLAQQALTAGNSTLVEILSLQRSLATVRLRHIEALVRRARAARALLAAAGLLPDGAPLPDTPDTPHTEEAP